MPQNPEAVLKDLKAKKYAPVYFLQGEEPYYIDLIADYIEQNVLTDSEKGFNQIILYGKDISLNDILNNAKRYPMMSDKQVVIVKEAQEIQDLKKAEAHTLLENYIKNPLPSTILVICHKYKTIDKRKSLGKTLDKLAILVDTKKLYDNQIPDWIEGYIQKKGFSIKEKAKHILAENIGNNLERLSNEIDKMLINFSEKTEIDENIIQKYVGISKDYNVFELQKALAFKNVLKANQIINYFGDNTKEHPIIPTIAAIFSFYSKILIVHHSKDKSESGLAKILRVHPYFVREYLTAAKNYPLPKVMDNIHHLRNADLQSKGVGSANITDGEILKELVFKLVH